MVSEVDGPLWENCAGLASALSQPPFSYAAAPHPVRQQLMICPGVGHYEYRQGVSPAVVVAMRLSRYLRLILGCCLCLLCLAIQYDTPAEWSAARVAQFIAQIPGLSSKVSPFIAEGVSGAVLTSIETDRDHEAMKELGVERALDRHKVHMGNLANFLYRPQHPVTWSKLRAGLVCAGS